MAHLRALRPPLIGAIQRDAFYEASRAGWSEMARTAELAMVLADFGGPPPAGAQPVLVNLAPV